MWKFGYAWKDEKLYCFTSDQILVMRLWPDMLAWRRTKTIPWTPTRKFADRALMQMGTRQQCAQYATMVGPYPEGDRVTSMFQMNAEKILLPALATIPETEERLASSLPERRWHALALMARCPGATELFQSNMTLGFALASNWVFHKPAVTQPLRSARALVGKKQKDILAWLGFPGTSSVRRILARIHPSALEIRSLVHLQTAIHRPEVQRSLVHLQHVTQDVLKFVCDQRAGEQIDRRLLSELSEAHQGEQHEPGSIYKEWCAARAISLAGGMRVPTRIRSVAQLKSWHLDVSEAQRQSWTSQRLTPGEFTLTPPYRGVPGISPICSGMDLDSEGHAMSNGVSIYEASVRRGIYFAYRVDFPVRATLLIMQTSTGWRASRFLGFYGAEMSADETNAVFQRLTGS